MEKLTPMTDFVLEQFRALREKELSDIFIVTQRIERYANFLKQELNIGMFVPAKKVDGIWVVLEEPKGVKCCGGIQNDCDCRGDLQYDPEEIYEYQKALENVLFEGFEVTSEDKGFIIIKNKETLFHWDKKDLHFWFFSGSKIEELIKDHELILTQSAKQKL